jgi:hypothetical protein
MTFDSGEREGVSPRFVKNPEKNRGHQALTSDFASKSRRTPEPAQQVGEQSIETVRGSPRLLYAMSCATNTLFF